MSESLEKFLEEHDLAILDTPRDGACFFHALRRMLKLSESSADIRRDVVKNIVQLMDKEVQDMALEDGELVTGPSVAFSTIRDTTKYETWEDYSTKMKKDDEYADDPCIWSAVMLYDVKIVVYGSDWTVRVFDKMESWGMGETSKTISIGNYAMVHFVATEADDLEYIYEAPIETISIMEMYNQTFTVGESLDEFDYDRYNLLNALIFKYKKARRTSGNSTEFKENVRPYLEGMRRDRDADNEAALDRKLKRLIEVDFIHSTKTADEYKNEYPGDYEEYPVQLLVSWFKYWNSDATKVAVDVTKKGRLLSILHMAIKIGLNYQMLGKFDVKFLPQRYDLDDNDLEVYFPGQLVPLDFKKVKMSDLASSPYWEGIRVVPDLGEYVSVEALQSLKTDQLVNMVKRTTLYRIHKMSKDYKLNLDEASPESLKQLCQLKTLELAPGVHEDACVHFDNGGGAMQLRYEEWLRSNQSFKPHRAMDTTAFITLPKLGDVRESNVSEVLNDLSLLPSLLKFRAHDDHENQRRKNGPLPRDAGSSDTAFAVQLSRALVELGFLPEGYERYCGVKRSETSGSGSRAKRPRDLFTAIEIH